MVPKRLTYHIWIAKFAMHCIGLQVFGDSADVHAHDSDPRLKINSSSSSPCSYQ